MMDNKLNSEGEHHHIYILVSIMPALLLPAVQYVLDNAGVLVQLGLAAREQRNANSGLPA
jgi:hypothetical protein